MIICEKIIIVFGLFRVESVCRVYRYHREHSLHFTTLQNLRLLDKVITFLFVFLIAA